LPRAFLPIVLAFARFCLRGVLYPPDRSASYQCHCSPRPRIIAEKEVVGTSNCSLAARYVSDFRNPSIVPASLLTTLVCSRKFPIHIVPFLRLIFAHGECASVYELAFLSRTPFFLPRPWSLFGSLRRHSSSVLVEAPAVLCSYSQFLLHDLVLVSHAHRCGNKGSGRCKWLAVRW